MHVKCVCMWAQTCLKLKMSHQAADLSWPSCEVTEFVKTEKWTLTSMLWYVCREYQYNKFILTKKQTQHIVHTCKVRCLTGDLRMFPPLHTQSRYASVVLELRSMNQPSETVHTFPINTQTTVTGYYLLLRLEWDGDWHLLRWIKTLAQKPTWTGMKDASTGQDSKTYRSLLRLRLRLRLRER